ncbi:hypothetical protein MNBD_NITROSPINAE01-805 [hydrothermal vent metagenome]|uniref:Uncharacterized protein n=1 Tax=hydrothermal vent metagenome TaxID=652676 RepID=A0A3B1CN06_9ZZZZ
MVDSKVSESSVTPVTTVIAPCFTDAEDLLWHA